MTSADGSGSDPQGSDQTNEDGDGPVHSQLVEALVFALIEKGVLTKNDALSIVQTVAQVQRGNLVEGVQPDARTKAAIHMLERLYVSFDALADRSGVHLASADNVRQLRPPIYRDRPKFPRDD